MYLVNQGMVLLPFLVIKITFPKCDYLVSPPNKVNVLLLLLSFEPRLFSDEMHLTLDQGFT